MDVAAVLPHELRIFLLALAAAVTSYLIFTSSLFAPSSQDPRAPAVRAPRAPHVIHITTVAPTPVRRGGAQR
jgi:hypothetical protein